MKVNEIQELIKFISKSGVSEVEIEHKDFKINIKTPPYRKGRGFEPSAPQQQVVHQMMPAQMQQMPMAAAPAQAAAPEAPATEAPKADENANYIEIKSPMIGTFYRKPSPDKEEFAKVGDFISEGDTVCVIEAMKLFNEIESEVSGKIVKVLVDDITPVEYDQVLFLVDPAG
ncbi:acetyl-CoA carboxylase biotin carboxyl carrier protein [Vicingaceae bacterium]|nr:acetyl-CoA carboxylase biotin carboxyl carrier protein [Vicingaceae bacterium]MDB4060871.1 acetyl-CoA carboxylase biotin carboxyl carrier protein [Vicingaceae bacterium]MDB9963844.1 acetyl-CoA carboxylase biotin carboxyl carrier protein [Vicingaceae bacterium]MDC1450812.1 acetyl-CoA carboxylase biotin carboxyl carrier protein [Vicingaceae bacterium]